VRLHSSKQKRIGAGVSQGSQTFALEVHLLILRREHIQNLQVSTRIMIFVHGRLRTLGQVYGEKPLGQILRVSAHWHWVKRQ